MSVNVERFGKMICIDFPDCSHEISFRTAKGLIADLEQMVEEGEKEVSDK
jgi:hypothetical protein